ncbi:hypothetical protein [Roseovarius aestuariivivens]|uniref:hypothetical protein n=1 Tax=Roseovarius aestuariivivens TaxID=1888910 RepID=UPI0010802884|nr:hypothetical protein [Roseovarius aestuariivivens]
MAFGRLFGTAPHGRSPKQQGATPPAETRSETTTPSATTAEPDREAQAIFVAQSLDILRQEWDHCQSGIRGLDTVTMRIRTWAVTIFGGCIVFSLREQNGWILLSAVPMLAIFYGIDVMFKCFQANFIHRTEVISALLRRVTAARGPEEQADILRTETFPLYDQYFKGWNAGGDAIDGRTPKLKTARELHTIWLYLLTIALAIGGYVAGWQAGHYPALWPIEQAAEPLEDTPDGTSGS